MGENVKQVRVDNWGIFFLQRLQMFFSKTDYCDMTLQFEGNVQLKVHRLVMNACTEYFEYLEKSCPSLEDGVILMPSNLQADVIVPIVNFIYTGMLEFNMLTFDKLYRAADLMNLNVLTKLLDAQKVSAKKKNWPIQEKKVKPQLSPVAKELPSPLPGRKLPVWKRRVVPNPTPLPSPFSESKWNVSQDSMSAADNSPKPTRFEWPEDDLPSLSLMDTSFDDISYTSKPLLTQAEEIKASTSFDSIRNSASQSNVSASYNKSQLLSQSSIDMDEVKDYVKEQKIRNDLEILKQEVETERVEINNQSKRKQEVQNESLLKRLKIEKENKDNSTGSVSVTTKGTDVDHTKIVSEILKKYPHLVKKNKNIRLKIVSAGNKSGTSVEAKVTSNQNLQESERKTYGEKGKRTNAHVANRKKEGDVWVCNECDQLEFQMFYLYKKHMIDVHNQQFDINLCKYCGRKCNTQNVMMYHLFTKHGVKSPKAGSYPKCNKCPYIALSSASLARHKAEHGKQEVQCPVCGIAFVNNASLMRHIQITNHKGEKKLKESFDCQFCTKRYIHSEMNLLAHLRDRHLAEARRDGLVIIDDDDHDEEVNEQPEEEQEALLEDFMVPSQMMRHQSTEKVNIISNVKVPANQQQEPSSEAEALNNVATGIATSLGLVDIVVLDDNQQYILQQQQAQTTNTGQPEEFILPDLSGGGHGFTEQVITTQHSGVLPQAMLQSGAGSNDELVMVLTDHDYQDGQESAGHVDNSNIVVLYSHPVDGQQQYITSQGNLMVNSETGMLEIRNGGTIESDPNQPIESIEMIQREIAKTTSSSSSSSYYQPQECKTQLDSEESLANAAFEETVAAQNPTEEQQKEQMFASEVQQTEHLKQNEEQESENDKYHEVPEMDATDGSIPNNQITYEQMDIDEPQADLEHVQNPEEAQEEPTVESQVTEEKQEDEGQDVLPDTNPEQIALTDEECPKNIQEEQDLRPDEAVQQEDLNLSAPEVYEPEAMEVDGGGKGTPLEDVQSQPDSGIESTDQHPDSANSDGQTIKDDEVEEAANQAVEPENNSFEKEVTTAPEQETEEISQQSATDCSQQENTSCGAQSETSNSQFNDDNSQSWQDSQDDSGTTGEKSRDEQTGSRDASAILEDWEDTDSQQSDKPPTEMPQLDDDADKNVKAAEAEARVHKLMNDWEEDEDEDNAGQKKVPPS
ncbi:centrosome-associated zinc finger protein CP190 isoform X3 [Aethina tumida]|uniref:centrosome-associated zinc finger protein CP190 isoform X3 n=1 Tax=Aethina tumida TaxID=116153 RepID=UPI0021474516|nr:centrosome-associated zinc finger protein CP190 isoform X3 [Aethina tumida]